MNPEDLNSGAAIAVSLGARRRGGIIDIGFEGALVANLKVSPTIAQCEDLQPQLMPGNTGVGKEGHLAEVTREISSADAHPVRTHECGPGAGGSGRSIMVMTSGWVNSIAFMVVN